MLFSETQKVRQPWIWAILIASWLVMIVIFSYGINQQLVHGVPFGDSPMSDNGLIITFILVFVLESGLLVFFSAIKLTTRIDRKEISYRFFPLHRSFRKIPWDLVRSCKVVTYNPVREYGGWGARLRKGRKAYSISGNNGIKIILKDGSHILIGTKKANELDYYLQRMK